MPEKISDNELRRRLEEFNYNVPPITDTTRNVLLKKLRQFEDSKNKTFSPGLDYSSGEDDFTPPVSSTRKQRSVPPCRSRSNLNGTGPTGYMNRPYKPNISGRNGNGLMQQSEEEEEEDSDEVEEDSDEKFEDYEEEVRLARNDLCVQTSFESPDQESRFRGKPFVPSPSNVPTSTIKSQHLRKNLDKFGSLSEALITLPTNKSVPSQAVSTRSHSPLQSAPVTQAQRLSPRKTYKENLGHNVVVSSLIIVTAALFFAFLCYQYVNLKSSPEHKQKIAICTREDSSSPCIPGTKLDGTVKLLEKLLKDGIHDHSCQRHKYSVQELKQKMDINDKNSEEYFEYVLMLLKNNPSWGIELVIWEDQVTHVVTSETSLRIYCWIEYSVCLVCELLFQITNYLLFAAITLACMYILTRFWKQYRQQREADRQEMFRYVERILGLLHEHHQTKDGHMPSYLAIDHIRDQLISPQDRESRTRIWKEVLKYIQQHESRVREEVQHIHGEEFRVWQWLPDMSVASPVHASPQNHISPNSQAVHQRQGQSISMVRTRNMDGTPIQMKRGTVNNSEVRIGQSPGAQQGWQGSAIQHGRIITSPVKPPTSCLKARYMFDASQLDTLFIKRLEKDIVSRCAGASILHIAIDTDSKDGIVYIKTKSTEDAGLVFQNINGQWYNTQLVVVKYLRKDRYHQRFPDSVNLEMPLTTND